MSEPKKRARKPEVSNPMLRQAQHDKKDPAINKSEIENPTSEIKNVEVHHHPEVEKKGFKEYLLEGLMIFLAVTMGFFAESLREHISNKDKTAQYMQSLLVDLKTDTTSINVYLKGENAKDQAYNSLLD